MKVLLISGDSAEGSLGYLGHMPDNIDITTNIIKICPSWPLYRKIFACMVQSVSILPRINNYDVIVSMSTANGLMISLIQRFLGDILKPSHIMVDIALPKLISTQNRRLLASIKYICKYNKKIICFGRLQKKFWDEIIGFCDRVEFIPFSIDLDIFNKVNNDNYGKYILSGGKSDRDYATLINAIKNISNKFMVIYGKDPVTGAIPKFDYIPPNLELIEEVPFGQYVDLLANASFVIIPLKDVDYVTGQMVMLHSMALCKAVIVTKCSGTIDYIEDWKTGIFVEPYNDDDLRNKVTYLIDHPEVAKAIGIRARKAVEDKFNHKIFAKNLSNIIIDVYNKSDRRRE